MEPRTEQQLERIRRDFDARAERIRSQHQFTAEAKQVLIAKAYVAARAKLDTLRESVTKAREDEIFQLQRCLFSIDAAGLTALTDPSSRSSAVVAHRDAQDRVAQLLDERPADREGLLRLLERADRTGDEFMARAVAVAATTRGWLDVLNAFAERRPHTEANLQRLLDLSSSRTDARDRFAEGMEWSLPLPTEVAALGPWGVKQLAEQAASITA